MVEGLKLLWFVKLGNKFGCTILVWVSMKWTYFHVWVVISIWFPLQRLISHLLGTLYSIQQKHNLFGYPFLGIHSKKKTVKVNYNYLLKIFLNQTFKVGVESVCQATCEFSYANLDPNTIRKRKKIRRNLNFFFGLQWTIQRKIKCKKIIWNFIYFQTLNWVGQRIKRIY